jgi:uncharacterized protein with HEPN domain
MYTEGYDQWIKINKNMTAPVTEWNKATSELCQRMAQQNLELIGENFSRLSDQLKRFTNIRKPEDFLNLQKEVFNEDVTATIECMQKIIHTSMENMEEFTKLCGSSLRERESMS